MNKKALIYCRVSSQQQVLNGNGVDSQEKLCRDYCRSKGYEVVNVFKEKGVSGGIFDRPAMQELLEYLDKHTETNYVVIFDDLKRFARDVQVHFRLRKELDLRGAKPESPNFVFEDTAENKFVETMLAATAELERNQNKRQVIQKMKARISQGYWCFCPPPGLKYKKVSGHGKILEAEEPLATIYKEALEKYADDYFITQVDVKKFIRGKYKEYGIKRRLSNHGTKRILTELLYTGYLEYPKWDVERLKGNHKGFISIETFKRIQDKLESNKKKSRRKDYSEDFPLRGLVLCSHCGKPLTASWCKGKLKYYPYYACKQSSCEFCWKAIPRKSIEEEFESLLSVEGSIKKVYLDLSRAVLFDVWGNRELMEENHKKRLHTELGDIESQLDSATDRLFRATDDILVGVYEQKIKELKQYKDSLQFKIQNTGTLNFTKEKFGTSLDKVFDVLEKPLDTWRKGDSVLKQTVVYMYFSVLPVYDKENGFGTPSFDCTINVLRGSGSEECRLVEMGGIEPPC